MARRFDPRVRAAPVAPPQAALVEGLRSFPTNSRDSHVSWLENMAGSPARASVGDVFNLIVMESTCTSERVVAHTEVGRSGLRIVLKVLTSYRILAAPLRTSTHLR